MKLISTFLVIMQILQTEGSYDYLGKSKPLLVEGVKETSFQLSNDTFDLQINVEFSLYYDPYYIFLGWPFYNRVEESSIHNVKHLNIVYDGELRKHVLKVTMHRDYDGDGAREASPDKQRTEIKASSSSDPRILGLEKDTMLYIWWFKIGERNGASKNFYHIFQLKHVGVGGKTPMFTISLRKIKLIDYLTTSLYGIEYILAPLSAVKGKWIQTYVEVKLDRVAGYIYLKLKELENNRMDREETLKINFQMEEQSTWNDGHYLLRPKWGIYRSLKTRAYLNEEDNLFLSDIRIYKKRKMAY